MPPSAARIGVALSAIGRSRPSDDQDGAIRATDKVTRPEYQVCRIPRPAFVFLVDDPKHPRAAA